MMNSYTSAQGNLRNCNKPRTTIFQANLDIASFAINSAVFLFMKQKQKQYFNDPQMLTFTSGNVYSVTESTLCEQIDII